MKCALAGEIRFANAGGLQSWRYTCDLHVQAVVVVEVAVAMMVLQRLLLRRRRRRRPLPPAASFAVECFEGMRLSKMAPDELSWWERDRLLLRFLEACCLYMEGARDWSGGTDFSRVGERAVQLTLHAQPETDVAFWLAPQVTFDMLRSSDKNSVGIDCVAWLIIVIRSHRRDM